MVELSPRPAELVSLLVVLAEVDTAEELLRTECAKNLPLIGRSDPLDLERIRFAPLKASHDKLDKLPEMVILAQTDWRDLLMVAGFGHETDAHERWAETVLGRGGGNSGP